MQLSQVVIASLAVKMASALSYVTVTQGGASYVEAITELSDLSAPPGAYITYSLLPLTKGTHSFIKTLWTTVYTNTAAAEASATGSVESVATSEAEETSEAVAESSEAAITSAASSAITSAASAVSSAVESAASSAAGVSSYEGGAGNLGVAAGVAGFAGVAALLI